MSDDLADLRTCIDRVVPPKDLQGRMALMEGSSWGAGAAVRVSFLDGDERLHERVSQVASHWLEFADLELFFGDDPRADIRISFKQAGSWSYIGNQSQAISPPEPTMNYGWLTPDSDEADLRRVVLHEFGHALGCVHEHQSPAGGIKWNREVVYAYYAGPPNHWSPEQVDHNIFQTYDEDLVAFTGVVDPDSIMMYPIDSRLTLDGFSAQLNDDLSELDKAFIAKMY